MMLIFGQVIVSSIKKVFWESCNSNFLTCKHCGETGSPERG